jgi:Ras homolog gene family, member A
MGSESIANIKIGGSYVKLALHDSYGQEDYDRLRVLQYPGSDVILICFGIGRPSSLENVFQKVRRP